MSAVAKRIRDELSPLSGPTQRDRDELRAKLQALAKEMLDHDAASEPDEHGNTAGVTFYQVRWAAEQRRLITDFQLGLSFGSTVMKMAGGVACEFRTSKHANAQRRAVRVYRRASVARR